MDSGDVLGLGNTFRALAVVEACIDAELTTRADVEFWVGHSSAGAEVVRASGFAATVLQSALGTPEECALQSQLAAAQRPELVVVDVPEHPSRPAAFYESLRGPGNAMLVNLSDQNEGRMVADLVVEGDIQHPSAAPVARAARPRVLSGVAHCLLNPVFRKARESARDSARRGVFLCFGGSDPAGISNSIIQALLDEGLERDVTFVFGRNSRSLDNLPASTTARNSVPGCCTLETDEGPRPDWCVQRVSGALAPSGAPLTRNAPIGRGAGWAVQRDITPAAIAEAMSKHAFGITSGGLMQYEAACLGLPCVVIAQNEGQAPASEAFHEHGVHHYAGLFRGTIPEVALDVIRLWQTDSHAVRARSRRGRELVDGLGCARLVRAIQEELACRRS